MLEKSTSTYKDSCGSTVLDMLESKEITEQIDWRVSRKRSEVMKTLRHYPLAQSQAQTIDRLEERGVEKNPGNCPRSALKRRDRPIDNQTTLEPSQAHKGDS